MMKKLFSRSTSKTFFIAALLVIAAVMLAGWRIMFYARSPDVIFLADRPDARWIKYDSDFDLEAKPAGRTACKFRKLFVTGEKIDHAVIRIQALKKFQVVFDGRNIFFPDSKFEEWKKIYDVNIPFAVGPGAHEIVITVISENAPPAVMVRSDNLPVNSGEGWQASVDGKDWKMAVPASELNRPAASEKYPSSLEALRAILPFLAVVFVTVLLISLLSDGREERMNGFSFLTVEPSRVRWAVLLSWALLAFNNIFNLNFQIGSDIWGHLDYLDFIIKKGSLPLAADGWQMFQAPLNYIISAPLYALLIKWFDLPSMVKIMTVLPVTFGLLQIEIVYRAARIVFEDRKDLQIIAVITGALLPVHTYACQYFGNEPLAGCLISLLVLFCIALVSQHQKNRRNGYFICMGLTWGLALLAKASAFVLAPVLVLVLIFHAKLARKPLLSMLKPLVIMSGTAFLIAGWYYVRNYVALGSPFAGIYDRLQMAYWWQEPGYRTWSQILSFGRSLIYPVYSGVAGFWDTLYSTLWLDGFNSGAIDFMPWNKNFMIAGALLALLPSMFMLSGITFSWINRKIVYRHAVIFSFVTIALFVVALFDVYMVRTAYSVTKASYTLGLLPCYSILIAAGAEPFLRNRITRSFVLAFFACWAFAAYAAYFAAGS